MLCLCEVNKPIVRISFNTLCVSMLKETGRATLSVHLESDTKRKREKEWQRGTESCKITSLSYSNANS